MTLLAKLKTALCELPISNKIVAICAISSFVTLSSLCTIAVYRDWHEFKDRKLSALTTTSEIVASNLQAPLRFEVPHEAEESLDSLHHEADIFQAAVFRQDRSLFASYSRAEERPSLTFPDTDQVAWKPDSILFPSKIQLDGQQIGTLLIEVDTRSFQESVMESILASIALLIGGMVISIILAYRMQRLIAAPIKNLDQVSRRVRNSEDYSTRAIKRYNDEIGSLVDSFNSMLEKIGDRDARLREINANLEQVVEQRTQDLRIQNLALKEAMDAANAASIAKSEFLATTSHELRTPLNPIIGYVEKIQRDQPNAPFSKELKLIKQSADQLLRLIEDILDFSRIESGTLRLKEDEVDIERLAGDVVSLLAPQAKRKSICLSHTHKDDCHERYASCNISIDEGRIRQVLLNLATNAIKFTQSGSVSINTCISRKSENEAILLVEVVDTGIGIEQGDIDKLFKPFSQLDASWTREYGGMGLGLAICQRIVKAMGGRIECQSRKDEGSRFFANIPVKLVAPTIRDEPDASELTFTLDVGVRVLLVEDEPVNRELMDSLLSSLGHQVTTANNGLEAVKRATEAEFDFILLDISMPKMDGFEATRRIRKLDNQNATIPIVSMTAHVTPEDKDSCFQAGMNDYLSKPISFTKLKTTLAKWLDRKTVT